MDDNEIVELYLNREESAISQTQSKYGRRLRTVSRGITADDCSAEEAENDTYLKAWESIPPNKPYNALFAYLLRIIRNLSLDILRKRKANKRAAMLVELSEEMEQCIPSAMSVEEEYDGKLLADKITEFLDGLPSEKRDIFMRRYWFLDSPESIAKRFALTKNSVNVTLFRLRKELKEFLETHGYNI